MPRCGAQARGLALGVLLGEVPNVTHTHSHEHDANGHDSNRYNHGHAHDQHDHAHSISPDADKRYLTIALALLLAFMAVEVVAGMKASSLALISDAGHMLTDAGAIAMSLAVMRLAQRPAGGRFTFGFKRAEIFSAQINGLTLVALAGWFLIEAVRRLIWPPAVDGLLVTWVALAGIVVNLLATWSMSKANRESLNVEGSFQHILTDLYAFIVTAIAGALIHWTHFYRFDALAALVVAALMLRAGVGLLKESGRVFLEAAPKGVDSDVIGDTLAADPGVCEVHDLHVWEVTSGFTALSAHVLVPSDKPCHGECHAVRRRLSVLLAERFDIEHVTLQVDHFHTEYRIPMQEIRQSMSAS